MSRGSGDPRAGLLSLGVGLAAAGVGAALGTAAERLAMGRPLLPRRREGAPDVQDSGALGPAAAAAGPGLDGTGPDAVPFGSLHGQAHVVIADDGTPLHVEVDEPDASGTAGEEGGRGRGRRRGPARRQPVTVVFSHGYALTLDSWHYQRKALRGQHRLVFWDQRGHGRSGTGPADAATIDQIGSDLQCVLAAVAPSGPLVLVGHSMGGMTVMSLAEKDRALFDERVLGVALVATSAGGLQRVDFGFAGLGRLFSKLAPGAVKVLTRTPELVERSRRLGSDLEMVLVRHYSFASPVSAALVKFCADMIAATRIEVISDFLPTFTTHDKRRALAALHGREVLVIVGDSDLLTPVEHSDEIVRLLPGSEHVVVRDAGHLIMLEHPEVVTAHLLELLERALRPGDRVEDSPRARPRVRRTVTPLRRSGRRRDGAA